MSSREEIETRHYENKFPSHLSSTANSRPTSVTMSGTQTPSLFQEIFSLCGAGWSLGFHLLFCIYSHLFQPVPLLIFPVSENKEAIGIQAPHRGIPCQRFV
jgi:hypothetical protein